MAGFLRTIQVIVRTTNELIGKHLPVDRARCWKYGARGGDGTLQLAMKLESTVWESRLAAKMKESVSAQPRITAGKKHVHIQYT